MAIASLLEPIAKDANLSLAKPSLQGPEAGKDLWTDKEVTRTENMPIELESHYVLLVRIAAPK
ncbi:MAG TPA: hypothetical protein VMW15_09970 [Terracidiphilus sp.]|jgi:hypothetical protein|nr:hypothetical protein [Terracidiphilus sp.]